MKSLKIIPLLFLVLSLCSCSPVSQKKETNLKDEPTAIEQKTSEEAETREPIFVYHKQAAGTMKVISLSLNDKPQLLSDSYVRLVGVVVGPACPVALIEIGGNEKCLRAGEDCGEYRVAGITENRVKLVRKEK